MRVMKISINDVNKVYWQHIKPYLGSMAIIIGSIIGATVMHLSVPWFYKLFFDVLFGDTEPFGGTVKSTLLLIVVLIFLVGTCVNIFWRISVKPRTRSDENISIHTWRKFRQDSS